MSVELSAHLAHYSLCNIHVDTIVTALILGLASHCCIFLLYKKNIGAKLYIRRLVLTIGRMVTKSIGKSDNEFYIDAPYVSLLFSMYTLIFTMNCMDLLPKELISMGMRSIFNIDSMFQVIPTEDSSVALACAIVWILSDVYIHLKYIGLKGYICKMTMEPLGVNGILCNLPLNIIKHFSKFIGLIVRVWGSMFGSAVIGAIISGSCSFKTSWILYFGWAMVHYRSLYLTPWIYISLCVPLIKKNKLIKENVINKANAGRK